MSTGNVADMVSDLREKIDSGVLKADEKLPSTRVLMEAYGLSDNAVYRAVGLLKAEGYAYGKQGKGVFVRGRRALIAGSRRIKGITHPGERIEWRYSRRTEAPAWVAEHLGTGECVERARTVRREDVIYEASRSWVRLDVVTVVPELDEPAPCNPTWQAVYNERSGNEVEGISSAAYARIATDDDREALGLDDKLHAVLFTRTVYATGDDVIGVGEAVNAPGQPLDLEA